jgi:hypothetical protein
VSRLYDRPLWKVKAGQRGHRAYFKESAQWFIVITQAQPFMTCSVLIVEDDAWLREGMMALLGIHGHRIVAAATGAEAAAQLDATCALGVSRFSAMSATIWWPSPDQARAQARHKRNARLAPAVRANKASAWL